MNKVSLTLETITPLFLSGNDQNSVEFRAPSIRGQLRYWYRALLGGLGVTQPNLLFDFESQVFGKEEHGSRVLIRVKDIHFAGGRVRKNEELDLGYDKTKKMTRHPGLTYLLYSTQLGGNKRPYADVGTTFTLDVSSFDMDGQKWLKLAACAIWCWCHFGGLGSRARRGAGNIQVRRIAAENKLLDDLPDLSLESVNDIAALKDHLDSGLKSVRDLACELNGLAKKLPTNGLDFPVLHPKHTDIWIIKDTWNDALTAMEQVGDQFQKFRHKRAPDFPSVLDEYLSKGGLPRLERPTFGIPLQFRYRSAPDRKAMVETKNFVRRASPLILRFLRLGNGRILFLLIHLNSLFLPKGEQLKIEDQSKGSKQRAQFVNPPTPAAQQSLIQSFRNQFKGYLDVRSWL